MFFESLTRSTPGCLDGRDRILRACFGATLLASTLLGQTAFGQSSSSPKPTSAPRPTEPNPQGIRDLGPYLRGQVLHFGADGQSLVEDSNWENLAEMVRRGVPDAAHVVALDANSSKGLVGFRLAATDSPVDLPRLCAVHASPDPMPFVWNGQELTDIEAPDLHSGRAYGLNEQGEAVGSYVTSADEERPFLWWNERFYDLQGYCWRGSEWRLQRAFDINEGGVIVGFGWYEDELRLFALELSAFLSTGGGPAYPPGGGPFLNVGPMLPAPGASLVGFAAPPTCLLMGGEDGTFGNWTCQFCPINGAFVPVNCATSANMVVAAGTPEFSNLPIPTVLGRGGNFSIRVGDTNANAAGNAIQAPFFPTASAPDFVFDYALVLQQCPNAPAQQTAFVVRALVGGNSVFTQTWNVNCGADPYFNCDLAPTAYRNWSCFRIPLGNFIGQQVTIRFETWDCSLGGHNAYAYIDIPCNPMDVELNAPPFICEGAQLLVDGTSNLWGVNHFWSIHELDLNGNPTHQEIMSWFPGPAGVFDITQFAAANGLTLTCGHKYNVKLALNSECSGWIETTRVVQVECPVADAGPDKDGCFPPGGTPPTSVLGNPQAFGGTPDCPYSYEWKDGSGTIIGTAKTISVAPATTTTYTLTVTDPCTGCSRSDTVTVYVLRPDMAVVITPTYSCLDFHIPPNMGTKLSASIPGYGGSMASYSWAPSGGSGSTIYVDPQVDTTYTVTVTHPGGCVTLVASFTVAGNVDLVLVAPNAFTPAQPTNNEFIIWHQGIGAGLAPAYDAKAWELRLFSQFGPQFLTLSGSPPDGGIKNGDIRWDGKLNGSYVPEDMYVYKLWLLDCSNQWKEVLIGNVYVLY